MELSKRILVAPLNWGLGHATRCIPIINALLLCKHTPIIGSNGEALALLRKEFPFLEYVELPSYHISYAKKGKNFKLKIIWDSPKIIKAISEEKKLLKELVITLSLDGVISDNRLGLHHKRIPCIFITHQLNVLSGNTTWMSSKMHQKIIKKFTECWVPDLEEIPNLSGKLGHLKKCDPHIHYIGPLSRFTKKDMAKKYDLMVLISGPEPQRTMLEEKLTHELVNFKGKIVLIKGSVEEHQKSSTNFTAINSITSYNFMTSKQLQIAFNESEVVLCRSGYTTIMDLAKLEKKAFFIPTPGQYEQEYLARRLQKHGVAPFSHQDNFKIQMLGELRYYAGLTNFATNLNYLALFLAFSSVNENSEPTSSTLST